MGIYLICINGSSQYTLEHGTYLHFHFKQLGIQLVIESIHFHESFNSFQSIQRMHCPVLTLFLVSSSLIQCCQVIFRVAQMFKGILHYNLPLQLPYLPSIRSRLKQSYGCFHHFNIIFVPSFMLMMGETSWLSFDKSIPVDTNKPFKNWTQKLNQVP